MPYNRMHQYPSGSIIQHRNGYIFIKQENEKWQPQSRFVMEQQVLGRDLEKHERVYHKDGDRTNNDPGNLVVIKVGAREFKLLERSVPLFIPNAQRIEA
jgi:hypothetical protein